MMAILAMWARRMSRRETAQAFQVSWEAVFRLVEWTVGWGLKHRVLEGVRAVGVDEIHWARRKGADGFLTVLYQIDEGMRRLLCRSNHPAHPPPAAPRPRPAVTASERCSRPGPSELGISSGAGDPSKNRAVLGMEAQ